jgi:hypothetical protein
MPQIPEPRLLGPKVASRRRERRRTPQHSYKCTLFLAANRCLSTDASTGTTLTSGCIEQIFRFWAGRFAGGGKEGLHSANRMARSEAQNKARGPVAQSQSPRGNCVARFTFNLSQTVHHSVYVDAPTRMTRSTDGL